MSNKDKQTGFTIVELLIVIVVIGILAVIVIVAYNGIKDRADDASLQSAVSQMTKKVLAYKTDNNDTLPVDASTAGIAAGNGHDLYYRVTPDGRQFCLAVNITGNTNRAFSATSTVPIAKKGTCRGYIHVPGNATLGTTDFWVMKYEAKNVNNFPTSQPTGAPWAPISQTAAITRSAESCDGCHLISEAEWMTIAGNVLGVASNWSGGSVGSGYIYSGHNDADPSGMVSASSDDSAGYTATNDFAGDLGLTNSMAGNSQRRTLTLTNGEVIWDLVGNAWEWTQGTIAGSQQPGLPGETTYAYKEWNNSSMNWGAWPNSSRPTILASLPGLTNIASWNSSNGIGRIYSNHGSTESIRGFRRGSDWDDRIFAGILTVTLLYDPSSTSADVGFRVAR